MSHVGYSFTQKIKAEPCNGLVMSVCIVFGVIIINMSLMCANTPQGKKHKTTQQNACIVKALYKKNPISSPLSLHQFHNKPTSLSLSPELKILMAVGRGGRSLIGPLLIVNFVVYLILLGLAAWSLDKYIDGEQNHPRKLSLSCSLSLSPLIGKLHFAPLYFCHTLHF